MNINSLKLLAGIYGVCSIILIFNGAYGGILILLGCIFSIYLLDKADMNSKNLVIIRGAPGSGKTTLANLFKEKGYKHFEADMFFELGGEGYTFDKSKLQQAHRWCKESVEDAMSKNKNVVVSNTFTKKWEMAEYRNLAKKFEYSVQEIICRGEFENVHSVSQDIVEKKRKELEL